MKIEEKIISAVDKSKSGIPQGVYPKVKKYGYYTPNIVADTIAKISPIVGVVIAVMLFMSVKAGYNADIGHFDITVPFVITVGLMVLNALMAIAASMSVSKYVIRLPDETDSISPIGMIACGAAAVLYLIICAMAVYKDMGLVKTAKEANEVLQYRLEIAGGITGIIGAIGIAGCVISSLRYKITHGYLLIFSVFSQLLMIFARYFRNDFSINASMRMIYVFITCGALLITVVESCLCCDSAKAKLTYFTSVFASGTVFGSSLALLITYIFEGKALVKSNYVTVAAFCLFMSVYAIDKVFTKATYAVCANLDQLSEIKKQNEKKSNSK